MLGGVSSTDQLLRNNERYASGFAGGGLSRMPARRVAVITCMDARLCVERMLGLREGDAHVLRNPGGVVTDLEIRALAISQRLMETEEVMVIRHTDCGMVAFDEDDFRATVEHDSGVAPTWQAVPFGDLEQGVRESVARIRSERALPRRLRVRGFVYDVGSGLLREVD
jgi:carbonic anhydrase